MNKILLPRVYLARHGETAWSISGQHTGLTDIPLTERGEDNAQRLGERLKGLTFSTVYTSPLIRAVRTCELAGFGSVAKAEPDLREWNYGAYEGRTSAEIQKDRPGWYPFRDGFPDGETIDEVGTRADRVVALLRATAGNALVFSHGHFLRFIAARWLGLMNAQASLLVLSTTSLSILGYEHNLNNPVIRLWNDTGHLED